MEGFHFGSYWSSHHNYNGRFYRAWNPARFQELEYSAPSLVSPQHVEEGFRVVSPFHTSFFRGLERHRWDCGGSNKSSKSSIFEGEWRGKQPWCLDDIHSKHISRNIEMPKRSLRIDLSVSAWKWFDSWLIYIFIMTKRLLIFQFARSQSFPEAATAVVPHDWNIVFYGDW